MYILLTYDIHTDTSKGRKKLAKVAKTLKNYGVRVQNSVWECQLYQHEIEELTAKLKTFISEEDGNIRVYQLPKNWEEKTTQIIGGAPKRTTDTLII